MLITTADCLANLTAACYRNNHRTNSSLCISFVWRLSCGINVFIIFPTKRLCYVHFTWWLIIKQDCLRGAAVVISLSSTRADWVTQGERYRYRIDTSLYRNWTRPARQQRAGNLHTNKMKKKRRNYLHAQFTSNVPHLPSLWVLTVLKNPNICFLNNRSEPTTIECARLCHQLR